MLSFGESQISLEASVEKKMLKKHEYFCPDLTVVCVPRSPCVKPAFEVVLLNAVKARLSIFRSELKANISAVEHSSHGNAQRQSAREL